MGRYDMSEHEEVIYGLNPAFETLRAGRRDLYRALLMDGYEKNKRLHKLADLLRERGVALETGHKGQLQQAAQSRDHQGVALTVSAYPYADLNALLESGAPLLLIDNIEDPHNLGAILRSAEVFGFERVAIPSRGVPGVYPSVVKVSAGACEHLLIARERSANQTVKAAREAGYAVYALDAGGDRPLTTAAEAVRKPYVLAIGGEDRSVGQYILNDADGVLAIPQCGRVNSLNASVAAGIAMAYLSETT